MRISDWSSDVCSSDLPIFLIGMMGAGKTTIGRHLARILDRDFVDLDHQLEARCGVRVSLIFDIEGEEGFRKRESVALDECSQRCNIVLATGGEIGKASCGGRVCSVR